MSKFQLKVDHHLVVDAIQFDSKDNPWPSKMKRWPDETGTRPRDASWGYVLTKNGRAHVHERSWIVTEKSGGTFVLNEKSFGEAYEPLLVSSLDVLEAVLTPPQKAKTSIERAAQLWCLPEFMSKQMDSAFCLAIALEIEAAELAQRQKSAKIVEGVAGCACEGTIDHGCTDIPKKILENK